MRRSTQRDNYGSRMQRFPLRKFRGASTRPLTAWSWKHIVTAKETDGQFSYHLVRIAPGKAIGNHIHQTQLETHEVIAGTGICVNNGAELSYEPGVITILPMGLPHEVKAGPDGLCLFAKFIPALT